MEYIDIYNDLGQKSGITIEKNKAHQKALLHKGVCVWIMNSNNQILLQKRNDDGIFDDMLDISFSGHIKSGESPIEAAIREGKEELGIDLDISKLQYLFTCREYGGIEGYYENEIDDVFIYSVDIPIEEFTFSDQEVKQVIYVSIEELQKMVEAKDHRLMPYDTHYIFLLTTLGGRVKRVLGPNFEKTKI